MKYKKATRVLILMLLVCTVTCSNILSVSAAEAEFLPSANIESLQTERGMYLRQFVQYDPTYNSIDYTHTSCGSVSGENTSSTSSMTIEYIYSESGSVSASLDAALNTTAKTKSLLTETGAEIGFTLGTSKTWTIGHSSGASTTVAPGASVIIRAYIPAVTTRGSLVYKVWMDGYESDWWYEYDAVSSSVVPVTNHIHFVISDL